MSARSEILTEALARLTAQKASGKILAGATVHDYPQEDVSGERDYPIIRFWAPSFTEEWRRGRPAISRFTMRLSVGTGRDAGIPAHQAFVDKVLDALEMDSGDDTIDTKLNGTIRKPMDFSVSDAAVTKLGIYSAITVTVYPSKAVKRGTRRS